MITKILLLSTLDENHFSGDHIGRCHSSFPSRCCYREQAEWFGPSCHEEKEGEVVLFLHIDFAVVDGVPSSSS